ncbi:MAG: Peptidyl-tRNA hydrolase [Candidatus Hydrogenedentes bacterium ADurb.Bin101]|nr:MAG: Peptidyl-tRNA hydrolase [Candidatus Hydrogenedentes bacterium ADurb.Bin101]
MKLVIGLGNPGPQYRLTRHNAGFIAADKLAEKLGTVFSRTMRNALVARASHAGTSVLLAKPQTFMNSSGSAVAPLAHQYGCAPEDILAIVDDIYLPLGTLRMRPGGGAAGHKGVLSIAGALGTDGFPRLRMGIGVEDVPGDNRTAFVLGRFTSEELAEVETMAERAVLACLCWLEQGIKAAMNTFNERGGNKGD